MTKARSKLGANTKRLYVAAQAAFVVAHPMWRDDPMAASRIVAAYLKTVHRTRGPRAVLFHLSAIARLYRESGISLDTKVREIAAVTARAKNSMAQAGARYPKDI
jgi:hypothetical protein